MGAVGTVLAKRGAENTQPLSEQVLEARPCTIQHWDQPAQQTPGGEAFFQARDVSATGSLLPAAPWLSAASWERVWSAQQVHFRGTLGSLRGELC